MARYTVQMTFEIPQGREPGGLAVGMVRGGRIRCLVGEGTVAVLASVKAESAADAAMEVTHRVVGAWRRHGTGPIRLAAWRASRVRTLVGSRGDVTSWWPSGDGGEGEDGGVGVREPRRPKPSPGSLSAAREIPRDPFGGTFRIL